jgi:FixJ family two-component response regulator
MESAMPQPEEPPVVYLVDDDPYVRRAVSHVIQTAGIEAREFGGVEGLMSFDIGPRRACVVADALVAGRAGMELPRRLREAGHDIPVILMTTEDNGRIRASARSAGALGLFRKPVDAQALIDAIEWALGDPGPHRHSERSPEEETP